MRRSLWPREHGAYFQLAIPLLTALVARAPTPATVLLAIGAACAFLANEPLLVVLGHRGPRRQATDGDRARHRLVVLVAIALALGASGLVLAPRAALAASIVAAPAFALLVFAWRCAEHTLAGELTAAVALTGAFVPASVAAGASLGSTLDLWAAWSIGFGASVVAVHRVMARHKRAATGLDGVLAAAMIALLVVTALAMPLAIPLVGLAAILVAAPPPATRLRAVGVAIVAAAIVASAIVIA
jgi:hypothetical protein